MAKEIKIEPIPSQEKGFVPSPPPAPCDIPNNPNPSTGFPSSPPPPKPKQ